MHRTMRRGPVQSLWVLAVACFVLAAVRGDASLVAAGSALLVLFIILAARGRAA